MAGSILTVLGTFFAIVKSVRIRMHGSFARKGPGVSARFGIEINIGGRPKEAGQIAITDQTRQLLAIADQSPTHLLPELRRLPLERRVVRTDGLLLCPHVWSARTYSYTQKPWIEPDHQPSGIIAERIGRLLACLAEMTPARKAAIADKCWREFAYMHPIIEQVLAGDPEAVRMVIASSREESAPESTRIGLLRARRQLEPIVFRESISIG
jgi:hypothetical protein